jgi:hypothetical protein
VWWRVLTSKVHQSLTAGCVIYDVVVTLQTCARCGIAVAAAASYITDSGTLCGGCFAAHETEEQRRLAEAADLDRSLARRSLRLARLHGVMWAATIIILLGAKGFESPWLTAPLVVAPFVLMFGLALRTRWAYTAALVIDGGAALLLLGMSLVDIRSEWPLLLIAAFPLFLAVMTRILRSSFVPVPSRSPETAP